jgi:hypothetical protein
MINKLMAVFGQSRDQVTLQLESGMIATDVYAHGSTIPDPGG